VPIIIENSEQNQCIQSVNISASSEVKKLGFIENHVNNIAKEDLNKGKKMFS